MKRIALWILLAATAAAALLGCSKRHITHDGSTATQVQPPATAPQQQGLMGDKITFLSFDGISGSLSGNVRLMVTVRNDSAMKITLSQARLSVASASSEIATATLSEPVELARHSTAQIALPMRLAVSNPIYAAILLSSLRSGTTPDVYVSLDAEVMTLGTKRKINIERRPLAEVMKLLNIK